MGKEHRSRYKIAACGLLLAMCTFATLYVHFVLNTDVVFTHFFYVPIILACWWWAGKGIAVAVYLSLLLIVSHLISPLETSIWLDLERSFFFIFVSVVVAVLISERQRVDKELRRYRENLEELVNERTAELEVANERLSDEIEERKKTAEELLEVERKLEGVVSSVTDHISVIDDKHNIVWTNDAARRFYNSDMIGKKCYSAYMRRDEVCESCIVRETYGDSMIHEHEAEFIRPDGKKMTFWCTSSVVERFENGRPKMVVVVSRDISRRKAMEEELEAFAHTVSHDLRSPLATIDGFAKLAIDAKDEGRDVLEKESLEHIIDAAGRMDRFIESLLQYA